jgi:6-phosphofructokinase 1
MPKSNKQMSRQNSALVHIDGREVTSIRPEETAVTVLPGSKPYTNPLVEQKREFLNSGMMVDEQKTIMFNPRPQAEKAGEFPVSVSPILLKLASPRVSLHFDPKTTVVGIVTCGGLCPGLNNVIRSLTLTAINSYHVQRVIGYKNGYWGLSKMGRDSSIELTPDVVRPIHRHGGTLLGSSRGGQNIKDMVDTLVMHKVNVLFTVGGDGTQKGAVAISEEVARRGLDIAVFGIPKTIDNDLSFSHRTFGYETAVEEAVRAIQAAYAEASSHLYGVGIVKLMGRHSGFIAAQATVSSALANMCLIPEVAIDKKTVLSLLQRRFTISKHCVIVVAEGFGQNWPECKQDLGTDPSGNKKLADIGVVVKDAVSAFLKKDPKYSISTVKYIDPSYMIRACPPSPSDAAFCSNLSTLAVHEAMAGNTACLISQWYSNYVLVPIKLAVSIRKVVRPQGSLWRMVREFTIDGDGDLVKVEKQEVQRELAAISAVRESLIARLSKL